ncbi:liposignal peptidase domain protein [Rickettsia amblyommatis str. Darkwater]|uniref:Liposignal peptidase domain protein n=1 Tax=Rickettsia amblyommatis str. Ac/Pa TaxID=1359164 RepID=A0A0F3N2X8_RICAM|nr:liposignal peptidase domain protein [Rickettsia amblyommatis str. Ac/Pa]KJV94959.1 liposignal peptidase domain protein [Rickettsia amblyommatis str. Darkwater]
MCHSREIGNLVKPIKNLFFIGLFYQIYNFVLILRLFFSGFPISRE